MERLPTEEAEDAINEKVMEPQPAPDPVVPNMQPIRQQEERGRHVQDAPMETLNELYGKLFFADGRSEYQEVNKHTPSGFLNEDEIRWMHGMQDIVRQVAMIEDLYGIPLGATAHFFQRKMDFTMAVSKSRNGFAVKEVSQTRVESDEALRTDTPDEGGRGLLDKIKQQLGGAGLGDRAVIGKPDYGTYVGGARQSTAETRPGRRELW